LWLDDSIELGFDGLQDHVGWQEDDHQFTLTVDGRIADYNKPTDAITAVRHILGGVWVLEVAITAEGLGAGELTVGKGLGFTFGLHDDDNGGEWDSYMVWEGDSTNSLTPEYGTLMLEAPVLHPALRGVVWRDADSDGVRDGAEPGIPAAVVKLYDGSGDRVVTTVTDDTGSYRFDGLGPATYVLTTEPQPRRAYRSTTPEQLDRTLESGGEDVIADFGFVPVTALSLLSFEAGFSDGAVRITWRTLREDEWISSWELERSSSESGPWAPVAGSPVAAQGMGGVGGEYSVTDGDAQMGTVHYYRLVALPLGKVFGPLSVDLTG
jgi:hypothetical protein